MSSHEFSDMDVAREAAQRAIAEIMRRYRAVGVRIASTSKSTFRDLVTDADRASEAAITEVLRTHRPADAVIAEEGASHVELAPRTWIVDPLDGTVNFAHGIPVFAVSIGLVVNGAPTIGVIDAPALGEHFEGEDGCGATLNGSAIAVSGTSDLREALVATGFAYDIENLEDDNLANFVRVAKRARGLRRLGSAALDFAWTAAGRFDGFWELHLPTWDIAAGAAIVLAAGGRVTDLRGGSGYLTGRSVCATNGLLHPGLLASLDKPSFS